MQIRPADLDDWEAILDIYNQAVRAGGASADLSPVTMAQRLRWFAEHGPDTYPIYIASDPDTKAIVGWCSLSPYRGGRLALRHVAEISYYIDYEHHGKGIAGQLIDHSLSECPRLQLEVLVAILLEVNQASIGLLLKRGFHRRGRQGKHC